MAAYNMGRAKGLKYVYIGNMPGLDTQHTDCPACGRHVIDRSGFSPTNTALKNGKCKHCGEPIAGVGMGENFS